MSIVRAFVCTHVFASHTYKLYSRLVLLDPYYVVYGGLLELMS